MKQLFLALGLIAASTLQAGLAADKAADKAAEAAKNAVPAAPSPRVEVFTSMGNFTIELNAERAPLTVPHFLRYVDSGQYTNSIFHRVIASFLIQGGGYDTHYNLKATPYKVFNESGNGLTNQRGTVGMARTSEPHGADSQFYVNLYDNAALDPNQSRWGYAVFGKIVQGMEVVDKIGNVSTGKVGPIKEDAPLDQVVILKIERLETPSQ
jgi:peptidyl-prolyl cis-trans isomerase A (cyclophilin A)